MYIHYCIIQIHRYKLSSTFCVASLIDRPVYQSNLYPIIPLRKITTFNTSEQSSPFNHEYGTVLVTKCTFAHAC
jgi:hypothetical protein